MPPWPRAADDPIAVTNPELTLHRRGEADWRTLVVEPGESVELASVSVQIALDDVYREGLEDI